MKASDSRTFNKVEGHIRKMTDDYLSLGVAVLNDSWGEACRNAGSDYDQARRDYRRDYLSITSSTFVRAYLREVAKECKRPFIVAEICERATTLTVPVQKRLEPLYAGFLLTTQSKELSHSELKDTPIYYRAGKTIITVTFQGKQGAEMFEKFIERCRIDEDYRKVLRTHSA